jgi:hypothetical protein
MNGTIDGKYENDLSVAEIRAKSVEHYLKNNFNLGTNQLHTRFTNSPEKPSTSNVKDGIEENRRVELSSRNIELFEPIFIKGEKKIVTIPDNVVFVPNFVTNKPIKKWTMEIYQSGRLVNRYDGKDVAIDSTLEIS